MSRRVKKEEQEREKGKSRNRSSKMRIISRSIAKCWRRGETAVQ